MHEIRKNARVLGAALTGTTVEFYDFYVYAIAAALVFGPLFFPAESPQAQAMFAFMSFGLAFLARPLGAIAFGHFGDRVGRKSTLVASLLLMGGSTLLIAFLPTYADLDEHGFGWIAPLLLCILRFGQGLGLGGEWGGAALLAVENAPPGWEARFGSAPQFGAPLGFLAANGLFLALGLGLDEADFLAWGWRVPFLASALLVAVGLWVRLRIAETPAFRAAHTSGPPPAVPFGALLRRHPGAVLAGSAAVIACFAIFYLSTAFALSYATAERGFARQEVQLALLGAIVFLALGIAIAALASDRFGARRVLGGGAVATALLGLAFGPILTHGSLAAIFVMLAAALLIMGFVYGPLGGFLSALYPVQVRYTGTSVAFTLGGIVGGAMTPIAAQALGAAGQGNRVGWLLCAAAGLTLLGVAFARAPAEE
jgi:MFS family permease